MLAGRVRDHDAFPHRAMRVCELIADGGELLIHAFEAFSVLA
jgi:hypothetical protein